MAAQIGPGDFVECVDARPFDWVTHDVPLLTLGAVYQIRGVIDDGLAPDGTSRLSVVLCEIVLPVDPGWQTEPSFDAARFRPIYRPRADFIESLKAPPINARTREREIV